MSTATSRQSSAISLAGSLNGHRANPKMTPKVVGALAGGGLGAIAFAQTLTGDARGAVFIANIAISTGWVALGYVVGWGAAKGLLGRRGRSCATLAAPIGVEPVGQEEEYMQYESQITGATDLLAAQDANPDQYGEAGLYDDGGGERSAVADPISEQNILDHIEEEPASLEEPAIHPEHEPSLELPHRDIDPVLLTELDTIATIAVSLPEDRKSWCERLGLRVERHPSEAGDSLRVSFDGSTPLAAHRDAPSEPWTITQRLPGEWEALVSPTRELATWIAIRGLMPGAEADLDDVVSRFRDTGTLSIV